MACRGTALLLNIEKTLGFKRKNCVATRFRDILEKLTVAHLVRYRNRRSSHCTASRATLIHSTSSRISFKCILFTTLHRTPSGFPLIFCTHVSILNFIALTSPKCFEDSNYSHVDHHNTFCEVRITQFPAMQFSMYLRASLFSSPFVHNYMLVQCYTYLI
jgi:hypothetical protein